MYTRLFKDELSSFLTVSERGNGENEKSRTQDGKSTSGS